ncbi:DUF5672 family protein [Mucilaginibacter psychrotolerans]|uniref:DUF5672 domain-containing protein n=1 Tax=Mucilaginibacter psychrotolerans TaxID=1524096 RepID=A0A4Y8SJG1_9SPHI|nr:DUF5672 family protein [Mucilaginibacter psychrotolerans]TFF38821.1 hypothetical protein E2R66_07385 [Mucilaginibacter psychrotolerans]
MPATTKMCVIIPVHKSAISADEAISLAACKAHLSGYHCYLLYPEGMDTKAYTALHAGLLLHPVNPDWLSSIEKYNKMKVSTGFYQLFARYEYMLTYELDAFIFNDGFDAAKAFAFDYIGAPFFEGYWAARPGAKFMKGCNSGFSVRNIQACIKALQVVSGLRWQWLLYRLSLLHSSRLRKKVNEWTNGRYEVFVTGRFAFNFANFHLNEDLIWSEVIPKLVPSFAVADPMSALGFSFEYNLDESLQLNKGALPLGCHAWAKHLDFWSKYINIKSLTRKEKIDEV